MLRPLRRQAIDDQLPARAWLGHRSCSFIEMELSAR
jgi:hypothetical protein